MVVVAWNGVGGTYTQNNDHGQRSLGAVLLYVLYKTHEIYILRIFTRCTKVRVKYEVEVWPGKEGNISFTEILVLCIIHAVRSYIWSG